MHRKYRIKEMREAYALRLRHQPKEPPVSVEAPGSPLLRDFYARLIVAVQKFIRNPSFRSLVGQFDGG
jgi:hypothetical protein